MQEFISMSQFACRHTLEEYKLLVNNVVTMSFKRDLNKTVMEIQSACFNSDADLNKLNSLDGLKATLDYVNEELSTHDTTLLESLDRRIRDVEEDIASIEKDRETSLLEKGQLNKEIQTIIDEKMASEKQNIKTIIRYIKINRKNRQ